MQDGVIRKLHEELSDQVVELPPVESVKDLENADKAAGSNVIESAARIIGEISHPKIRIETNLTRTSPGNTYASRGERGRADFR